MGHHYFPIFVNLEGKQILVIGAGRIATGRIEVLLGFGASLTVVALKAGEKVEELHAQGKLKLQRCAYREEALTGMELVLAATDDAAVNTQVVQDCRKRGIPVNNCADQKQCDFFFPAIIETDGLVFGVSSGGKDHRKVRETCAAIRRFLQGGQT